MDEKTALRTLEMLPVSRWHWNTFWILGFALQFNGFLNSSGSAVMADLVGRGWSNNYWNAVFSSAMMAGFFIGSLVAGALGDRIGRKRTYELCILTFGSFALLAALAPNMPLLIICRGLMGIGMGGGIVLGYGSFTEFIPARVRGKWSARISLLGNLSPLIALAVGAALIPITSWRAMFVVGGLAALIMLVIVHKKLDESPRWMIETGNAKAGIELVERVAAQSGPLDDTWLEENRNEQDLGAENALAMSQRKAPVSEFFKGDLGRRTLVAATTLIAMNLSLYTITVWIPTIFVNRGIDIRSSLVFSMTMMIGAPVGVWISTLIMDKFPRRILGSVLIVTIAALGYVYSLQTSVGYILAVGTLMILVLYIYNSFASAVYAPELWPTEYKMRGLGIANGIGRIVAILSPYLVAWLLTDYGVVAVFVVLGIQLTACAVVLFLFGIETRSRSCEEMAIPAVKPFAVRLPL
jgi:putative MFS transporter